MKEYMRDVYVQDAIKAGRNDTICWDCKKACRGGCSWTDPKKQEPVKDWVATLSDNVFVVHACPEFDRETYGGGMYRTADDYILALEIAVTERNAKIDRLRRTTFWKYGNKLARECLKLRKEKKELEKRVDELEMYIRSISKDGGEEE